MGGEGVGDEEICRRCKAKEPPGKGGERGGSERARRSSTRAGLGLEGGRAREAQVIGKVEQ